MRDNLHIFHTTNSDETIQFLKYVYYKFVKHGTSFITTSSNTSQDENIINSSLKSTKNHNITFNICNLMMLQCIPLVSHKISMRILSKYPSFLQFIYYLNSLPNDNDKLYAIQTIDFDPVNPIGFRKIPINVAQNILKFVFINSQTENGTC